MANGELHETDFSIDAGVSASLLKESLCPRSDHRWRRACRMHLDEMIQAENDQRHPHRGRGARADLKKRKADNGGGEDDFQVDGIAGYNLDLAIDLFEKIDDRARGMGMFSKELGFPLDFIGQIVDFAIWGPMHFCRGGTDVLLQRAMKLVMSVDIVKQNDAAGRRIDIYVFDTGNNPECFFDLREQIGVAFR